MKMDDQKFCLKWDGFQNSVLSVFDHLRQDEELVDVTLCCEGQKVMAHRMMLSACSPYFRDLLKVGGGGPQSDGTHDALPAAQGFCLQPRDLLKVGRGGPEGDGTQDDALHSM